MTRSRTLTRARRWPLLASAALLAVTLVGCGSEDDDESGTDPAPTTPTTSASSTAGSESGEQGAELPAWSPKILTEGDAVTGLDFTDTPKPGAELQVATVTKGDGPKVEAGQSITVHYYGSLYQSEKPFDESYSGGQPATFAIGVGQVIPGWDQAIPGIPVGSRIIMSIPPDLGYGAAGSPPVIPANAPLFFVVDILSVDDGT
ncbi:FKBP-type peptidyl-prolyl cis-trans isomerase [Nocardioides plantarum]|uniref:Peptidyl-prolyl cis-trans isomerase n=1 Tax=Nocardioides plantarum TaxID=29299 RepID=A0ABV5KAA4_9ACTN|nr:FKBP-type peptidyl-prolyl cis-trans isomerase [Nocardioides plantarum]